MLKNLSHATALATILGCLALASPVSAAPFGDNDASPTVPTSTYNAQTGTASPDMSAPGAAQQAPSYSSGHHHMGMKTGMHSPEAMRAHVEERIKSLHQKLAITKDQEPEWNDVAQAMRDSEANVVTLIQERHQNTANRNAVDDLDSYQKIAQAHADGLKNVSAAFSKLYADMNDNQKKNADVIFSKYEGHGEHMMKKASAASSAKPTTTKQQ